MCITIDEKLLVDTIRFSKKTLIEDGQDSYYTCEGTETEIKALIGDCNKETVEALTCVVGDVVKRTLCVEILPGQIECNQGDLTVEAIKGDCNLGKFKIESIKQNRVFTMKGEGCIFSTSLTGYSI